MSSKVLLYTQVLSRSGHVCLSMNSQVMGCCH